MSSTGRPEVVVLDGREIPVLVTRNRRARRMILRLAPEIGGATVTLPWHVPKAAALAMVREKAGWLLARLKRLPPRVPFAEGAEIPWLGEPHHIRHAPGRRGGVWREDGEILVAGLAEHLPRRVADWLKREARREIAERVRRKSLLLGRQAGRVAVRDTRSRWGSCAASGNLNFSWRLILAPDFVLDYVVAHEVAHLKVKDHGPRFWRTVDDLTPHAKAARAWLNRHGTALHGYG
ncbi:MAG: M48 family metallopeptidase [Magnetospirillum sp. WYHS-4]